MAFRALATAAAMALTASACNAQSRTFLPVEGDAYLGKADAQVVLVEYGAPTCPACKFWHDEYWKDVKSTYVDTNKIKFVFRPLPSHNPPVDAAIAAIARCSGAKTYFEVLDDGFARQQEIEQASQTGKAREALIDMGKRFGLSETQTRSCIENPANTQRIQDVQTQATADKVAGTPSFILNGKPIQDPRFPSLSRAIEEALASSSSPAPGAP